MKMAGNFWNMVANVRPGMDVNSKIEKLLKSALLASGLSACYGTRMTRMQATRI